MGRQRQAFKEFVDESEVEVGRSPDPGIGIVYWIVHLTTEQARVVRSYPEVGSISLESATTVLNMMTDSICRHAT